MLFCPSLRSTQSKGMINAVLHQVVEKFPQHLELLCNHIRQVSVSTNRQAIDAILARLAREISALGGNAEIIQTPELPVIYANFNGAGQRTVLFHCMYDTVPADEPDWIVPPFEARRITIDGKGDCIVGR